MYVNEYYTFDQVNPNNELAIIKNVKW